MRMNIAKTKGDDNMQIDDCFKDELDDIEEMEHCFDEEIKMLITPFKHRVETLYNTTDKRREIYQYWDSCMRTYLRNKDLHPDDLQMSKHRLGAVGYALEKVDIRYFKGNGHDSLK